MPRRNKGIGAMRKREAVTSTPKETTPDKEDEPEVAEGEEAETPEFDDEVIEKATDNRQHGDGHVDREDDRHRLHGRDSGIPSPQAGDSGGRRPRSDRFEVWVWEERATL